MNRIIVKSDTDAPPIVVLYTEVSPGGGVPTVGDMLGYLLESQQKSDLLQLNGERAIELYDPNINVFIPLRPGRLLTEISEGTLAAPLIIKRKGFKDNWEFVDWIALQSFCALAVTILFVGFFRCVGMGATQCAAGFLVFQTPTVIATFQNAWNAWKASAAKWLYFMEKLSPSTFDALMQILDPFTIGHDRTPVSIPVICGICNGPGHEEGVACPHILVPMEGNPSPEPPEPIPLESPDHNTGTG